MSSTIAWVKSILRNNAEEIAKNSYRNCHAVGVDSFLLKDGLRMFRAEGGYTLESKHLLSPVVGFHTHKTDLDIVVLSGEITNALITLTEYGDKIMEYRFTSFIRDGKIDMHLNGDVCCELISRQKITAGESLHLDSREIHTIWTNETPIPPAWLIYEGKEDDYYEPLIYTNRKNFDFKNLYQPMTREYVLGIERTL